ncbi:ectonucleoside triphosphate diphosphohydrolase 5 isoform X4 [Bufo bufo]|uniref:ectonucleoside triphosphate diphosphohydrolase 5 isoform X4 n=1 Tax=Bufo bufo TaxID=8384 RepID=UPI001ABE665F|nr:ectonucleoside triphosphate diphosphohydrolase 5 isoform X4 [Bufo bufo]
MSLLLSAAFTLFLAFLPGDCSLDSFASRNVKSTSPSTLAMPSISCHTIYGIVFDAGSTGTRIHIYKFHQSDAGSPLELDGEIFESVKPGLSAFAGEPERVRKVFSSSPFLVPENSVSIMEGTDEGVLAWITVNFLTGRLHGDRSVGTLDLGGGSTQITFLPLAKATLDQSPGAFLTSIELFNSTYRLYTRSYLGLGLKAARLAVLGASVSAAQEKQIFRSPCFPAALDAEWTFAGVTYRYAGQADGLVGFDACYSEVLHILQGNVHQVDEMRDGRFYAFSYYYDRAVDTNLIEHEDGGALAVRDFALKAREVCDHMDRFASQSPFLCMDLTYITALLRDGFGFEEDTTLQLTKKVRDVETGWALGAIFLELQPLVHSG